MELTKLIVYGVAGTITIIGMAIIIYTLIKADKRDKERFKLEKKKYEEKNKK